MRKSPIILKDKAAAELLNCPFFGFPKQKCDTIECISWNVINGDSGYCKRLDSD